MKIVVCVKQVPGGSTVSFDSASGKLKRDVGELQMNPFDTYALEQGVQLKEKLGGEVIVVTLGPVKAEAVLREALSAGADKAIHVTGDAFAGSDAWVTGRVLAAVVKKIGDADLVICGKSSIDGGTGQVGPSLAGHIGFAQAANISGMGEADASHVVVTRMFEDRFDEVKLTLPAVVTVVKDINTPRIPSLKGRMAAKKAEIPVWTEKDLDLDASALGAVGSPTKVVKVEKPETKTKQTLVIQDEAPEAAAKLVRELRTRTLV